LISLVWAAAIAIGLWITKSNLPGELRRRKKPAAISNRSQWWIGRPAE